jgi:hypothetical protein
MSAKTLGMAFLFATPAIVANCDNGTLETAATFAPPTPPDLDGLRR